MSSNADEVVAVGGEIVSGQSAEFVVLNEAMFGPAIQEFRHRSATSQADLAERLDLHRSYLSALENGRSNAAMRAIMRACRELGLEVVVRPKTL